MSTSTHSVSSLLGWAEPQQRHYDSIADSSLIPARVASVDRGALTVLGARADPLAPLVVPHRVGPGPEAPTVGDWVLLRALSVAMESPAAPIPGEPGAPAGGVFGVVELLPRTSLFVRKEVGRGSAAQPVAANVDTILVVTAVGDNLSPGRIERYVTAIHAGGALPVIVVNKSDRPHDVEAVLAAARAAAPGTPVVRASALSEGGLDELLALVPPPLTVALVGSSGVGKTSILNRLLGGGAHAVSEVRSSDDKGRHTTTRRELVVTPSGLLVIDTPGVREIGLWDASAGIDAAFPDIAALAATCRFTDCAHDSEPGCAVRAAIEQGSLPAARVARHERLVREIAHNDARAGERRNHDKKKQKKAMSVGQREGYKLSRKLGFKG